jgi:hypothetical protein
MATSGLAATELVANAPDQYIVKAGDTLWGISSLYLKSPWRWSELWGMNKSGIQNPNLIYPGQVLHLVKQGDSVSLSASPAAPVTSSAIASAQQLADKLSPSIRTVDVDERAIPTLRMQHILPFLIDPVLVEEDTLSTAPRVVAIQDGRVVAGKGDRIYALSSGGALSLAKGGAGSRMMRVVRNATPLNLVGDKTPLGFEAQYIAKVRLLAGETRAVALDAASGSDADLVPATLEVVYSKEEIRVGDRLIPEAEFELRHYQPKAPDQPVVARVLSIHGNAVANAAQNQVLAINKGKRDGLANGDVLTFMSLGQVIVDRTNGVKQELRLPNERKGWAMVFRVFDKVSYVLVLESTNPINLGDYLVNPN